MDTFKHVSRPAVWIVILTLAFTTGVSMVLADHREPPQVYLLFDGIDDYVQVEHHADLSIATTGQLTVAVWMQPATLYFPTTEGNGYVHWLSKGGPNQYEWAFRMYSKDTTDSESPRRCNESEPFITTRQNRISFYVWTLAFLASLTLVDTENVARQGDNRSVSPPPDRPSPARCVRVRSDVDARHQPENASVPWRGHDSSAIVKMLGPERPRRTTFLSLRRTAPESRPNPTAV